MDRADSTAAASAELRAFEATVRAGSMSGAARALGITQPTISAHIASLERRYGVELFYRRGRRVDLTEFGEALHEHTLRMFRAEQDAVALLQEARTQYRGRLHICAVGPYNVTPILTRYRERWPAVGLRVSVGDSKQIVERILAYEGDVGVLVHAVADARILCVPYRRQPLIVFAPVTHRLAAKKRVRLADLEGEEFVMREVGSTTRSVFERALADAGVHIRVSIEMGSRESVREAVAQGLGLGIVADRAYVADPRLVPLPIIETNPPETHSHIICLQERRQARLIANFLAVVEELRAARPTPPSVSAPIAPARSSN